MEEQTFVQQHRKMTRRSECGSHDADWRRCLLDGVAVVLVEENQKKKSENTDYSMKGESDVRMTLHEARIS